jgi:ABC-type dipeptide/oligopeptide/nickel transport system permease component
MGVLVARRLLQSLVVILGVTLISFIALHAGGDPTNLFVSERATAEEIALVRHALGFDRPLHVQYLSFVADLARGDFGTSLSYRQPAIDIVLGACPATIELAVFAFVIAIALAVPLGVVAALNRGTAVDGSIMAMGGRCVALRQEPGFWSLSPGAVAVGLLSVGYRLVIGWLSGRLRDVTLKQG